MMVIMDAFDDEYKDFDKDALSANTHEHIRAPLDELHEAHFVKSDVRNVNMVIRKDGKPGFDWAGVIGKAHYYVKVSISTKWIFGSQMTCQMVCL